MSEEISAAMRADGVETYAISIARWPDDLDVARRLLANYGQHLAASSIAAAGFCFSNYEAEVQALPGKYGAGQSDLLLARVQGEGAGCVAITRRLLPDGTRAAEMKRLWVESRFRGQGIGRGLVLSAIEWARRQGDSLLVLDTVKEAMPEASDLYRSLGFEEISRFNDNPVTGVHFYQFRLQSFC